MLQIKAQELVVKGGGKGVRVTTQENIPWVPAVAGAPRGLPKESCAAFSARGFGQPRLPSVKPDACQAGSPGHLKAGQERGKSDLGEGSRLAPAARTGLPAADSEQGIVDILGGGDL